MHASERLAEPLYIGYIVYAVQAADNGVDSAVKVEAPHILMKKYRLNAGHARAFSCGHGEHIRASVGSDHLISAPSEYFRH
ncbi:hypothetical protein SDC9_201393 [bioreactor metagenome]|uniref:Uncharacterized protein n=1 Tax=bioreactor metagenome TaxID=1076179 RepID=A0A645IR75_9ZZZZ